MAIDIFDHSRVRMQRSFVLELGKTYCDLMLMEGISGELYLGVQLEIEGDLIHDEVITVAENPELKSLWNRKTYRFKASEVSKFTRFLTEAVQS